MAQVNHYWLAARFWRWAAVMTLPMAGLIGCAALLDAPRLTYQCDFKLMFEARLYADMALLEGLRGHAVLERVGKPDAINKTLEYSDETVDAVFGLGVNGRLVRLRYTGIPEPVYCERVLSGTSSTTPIEVRAASRKGPRPPPPFDPDAPVQTNIRTSDGQWSQGS